MKKQKNTTAKIHFAICIVGRDQEKYLEKCIGHTSKISQEILYVDLGSKDKSMKRAKEFGARVIEAASLLEETSRLVKECTSSNWLLFLKPDERVKVQSRKKVEEALKSKVEHKYAIIVKNGVKYDLLDQFQMIRKLGQFRNVKNCVYVSKLQIRLVRRECISDALSHMIHSDQDDLAEVPHHLLYGLIIDSIQINIKKDPLPVEDHDLRCLKGEITYDAMLGEELVELSEIFSGFRVVHKGQLDGYMKGAQRGLGHSKMYMPMLDFLCKEGCFNEARDLFETWIEHRPDDKEKRDTRLMGGLIYANLLEIDKAIQWVKEIADKKYDASALANLGKFYLVISENEKALEYLTKSGDAKAAYLLQRRIQLIMSGKEWQPSKLSLCMIARDEETQIERALRSMAGIADEIIVVDTGSSDRTTEIVKHFGGKVIETEWEDDFSKARNLAIEEATGDHILFMDADEYIDPRDRFSLALLKKLLPPEKDIAFSVKLEPYKESKGMSEASLGRIIEKGQSDYQIRLFPKKTGIRFEGKVFERVDEAVTRLNHKIAKTDEFKITHSMEEREKRDKRKMPAVLTSFESIHDPQKALECVLFFLRLGDFDRAYHWFKKAEGINPEFSAKMGKLYLRHNKPEMAKNILEGAIGQFPEASEVILSLAELYFTEGNYEKVTEILRGKIEAIDYDIETDDAAALRYFYGVASIEMGDLTNGIEQITLAYEGDRASVRCKMAGVFAFAKVDKWEEALQGAAQIAEEEHIKIVNEVNNFVDVARVFTGMFLYFDQAEKVEEANLCSKIIEDIIRTKLSGDEDIQRMLEVSEGVG